MQAPNGLQEVFTKFPKWFQEGYKGKGHEVGHTCQATLSNRLLDSHKHRP
jgi:hypothetical protein